MLFRRYEARTSHSEQIQQCWNLNLIKMYIQQCWNLNLIKIYIEVYVSNLPLSNLTIHTDFFLRLEIKPHPELRITLFIDIFFQIRTAG